jgi:hypothetical protein
MDVEKVRCQVITISKSMEDFCASLKKLLGADWVNLYTNHEDFSIQMIGDAYDKQVSEIKRIYSIQVPLTSYVTETFGLGNDFQSHCNVDTLLQIAEKHHLKILGLEKTFERIRGEHWRNGLNQDTRPTIKLLVPEYYLLCEQWRKILKCPLSISASYFYQNIQDDEKGGDS